MMARKALGLRVILFLLVLSGLLYYVKKKIWAKVGGEVHGLQPELHKTY
jgi:cytochrome c1